MEDNNNNNDNLLSLDRSELIDRLMSASNEITNLTERIDRLQTDIDTLRTGNRKNVERIIAVVNKFRSELIDGNDVTIDDWDALQEWFDDFDGIADLNAPVRTVEFEICLSTVITGRADVTDGSLDEDEIREIIIEGLDLSQRLDVVPSYLDGFENIDTDTYYNDFEVEDSTFSVDD
jgi:hypothetical protein